MGSSPNDKKDVDVYVKQLLIGHCRPCGLVYMGLDGVPYDMVSAGCSITLVEENDIDNPLRVLVDCGSVGDRDALVKSLRNEGLAPADITHLVLTHWHADHVGNIDLFPNAELIDPNDYEATSDGQIAHNISNKIAVLAFRGHSALDIAVMVQQEEKQASGTLQRTICIAGDIFECSEDRSMDYLWKENSLNVVEQLAARLRIMEQATVIIPGHGRTFDLEATLPDSKSKSVSSSSVSRILEEGIALVQSQDSIILVNSGGCGMREMLLKKLMDRGIKTSEITHVVVTKPCVQNCYNIPLFPNATLIMGSDLSFKGGYFGKLPKNFHLTCDVIVTPVNALETGSGTSMDNCEELIVVVKRTECDDITIIAGIASTQIVEQQVTTKNILALAGCKNETRADFIYLHSGISSN